MAGTYFSEIRYEGPVVSDFIEVAVPAGTDTSGWTVALYNSVGDYFLSMTLGCPVNTQVGQDIYVLEQGTPNFVNLDP